MGLDKIPYEKMISTATNISSLGQDLSKSLQEAWRIIESMHGQWDGDRWNDVAKAFNDVETSVNELSKYVTEAFSKELGSIGTAFTAWDTGATKEATISTAVKVQTLTATAKGTGKLTFDLDTIKSLHTNANKTFSNSSEIVKGVANTFNGLSEWTGDTAEGYKGKINTANNKIQKNIDDLRTEFDKAMQEALAQYEKIQTQINSKKG